MPEVYDVRRQDEVSLHLLDLMATPAQYPAIQHAHSLYFHQLTVVPRELMQMDMFIKIGGMSLAPDTERTIVGSAKVPMMSIPMDDIGAGDKAPRRSQDAHPGLNPESAYLSKDAGSTYNTLWKDLMATYGMMLDYMPEVEIVKEREDGMIIAVGDIDNSIVAPTPHFVTWLFNLPKLNHIAMDIHSMLTRVRPFGSAEYVPIGWAASMDDKKHVAPGTDIRYDKSKVKFGTLLNAEWDWKTIRMQAMFQCLLGYSYSRLATEAEDVVYDNLDGVDKRLAFHALAAMDLGLLSGWKTDVNTTVKLAPMDLLTKMYPWLTLPFSRGYPFCRPSTVLAKAKSAKIWLLHNMLRYMISERCGASMGELIFENIDSQAAWHQAKTIARDLFTPAYHMGGNDDMYLMPPFDSRAHTLYDPIPYPLVKKEVVMETRAKGRTLKPSVLDMVYGEFQIPNLDVTDNDEYKRYIVKVLREGRISEHIRQNREFLIMRVPIIPRLDGVKGFTISAYLADYGDIPGGVAFATPTVTSDGSIRDFNQPLGNQSPLAGPKPVNREVTWTKHGLPLTV